MTESIGFGLGSFLVSLSLSLDLLDDDLDFPFLSSSDDEDDNDLARLEARRSERERDFLLRPFKGDHERRRERDLERRDRRLRDPDLDRRRFERCEADDEEPPTRPGERRRSSRRSRSLDFPASRRASSRSL